MVPAPLKFGAGCGGLVLGGPDRPIVPPELAVDVVLVGGWGGAFLLGGGGALLFGADGKGGGGLDGPLGGFPVFPGGGGGRGRPIILFGLLAFGGGREGGGGGPVGWGGGPADKEPPPNLGTEDCILLCCNELELSNSSSPDVDDLPKLGFGLLFEGGGGGGAPLLGLLAVGMGGGGPPKFLFASGLLEPGTGGTPFGKWLLLLLILTGPLWAPGGFRAGPTCPPVTENITVKKKI